MNAAREGRAPAVSGADGLRAVELAEDDSVVEENSVAVVILLRGGLFGVGADVRTHVLTLPSLIRVRGQGGVFAIGLPSWSGCPVPVHPGIHWVLYQPDRQRSSRMWLSW